MTSRKGTGIPSVNNAGADTSVSSAIIKNSESRSILIRSIKAFSAFHFKGSCAQFCIDAVRRLA